MAEQLELFPEDPTKEAKVTKADKVRYEKYGVPEEEHASQKRFEEEMKRREQDAKAEKAKARAAENEEFKDKRTKASPLVQKAEVEKMREILSKPKGGGGGGGGIPKSSKHEPFKMKSGGKVSSASKRADGCCIRGKTRA